MDSYLKVSAQSMKRDSEKLEELKQSIPNLIKGLSASMQQLSNCWEGPAWAVYQANVAYYVDMLGEIYNYLCSYTVSLQESEIKYARTEQDICANISKINTW